MHRHLDNWPGLWGFQVPAPERALETRVCGGLYPLGSHRRASLSSAVTKQAEPSARLLPLPCRGPREQEEHQVARIWGDRWPRSAQDWGDYPARETRGSKTGTVSGTPRCVAPPTPSSESTGAEPRQKPRTYSKSHLPIHTDSS